jgi:TetR/AcrR family transcriptional regulator
VFKFVAEMKKEEKDPGAEEKIREAAKRVFIAKGFDGCSSREIAREAGMNVALVNYYFRSKGQLFQLIFQAALEDFLLGMMDIFESGLSLENKVRIFIEREFDFLAKHPEMPVFIMSEVRRDDGCSLERMDLLERIRSTGIFEEALKAQEEGRMRKIDMASVMILMMGSCQFPFLAGPLMKGIHKLDEKQYEQQLLLHKQYVTEMLIGYFFYGKELNNNLKNS